MVKWLCFFKHDLKSGNKDNGVPGISVVSGGVQNLEGSNTEPAVHKDNPEDELDDDTAPGFCCWKGCITGTLAVFLFFVIFPTGILLLNYSSNKKDTSVRIVGILLTILPLIVLCIITAVIFHRRRLIKRQRKQESQPKP